MSSTKIYQERKLKNGAIIIAVATFLGLLYPLLSRELSNPYAVFNGIAIGFIGGLFITFYEQGVFRPLERRMNFLRKLMIKSFTYTVFFTVLILGIISVSRSIENSTNYFDYLASPQFSQFIFNEDFFLIILYTLLLSATVSFVRQLSRKMGQGVLWNIISGRYHHPREEERIFMFMDLKSSTAIAEKLGDIKFNQLLNEFFFDVTGSILTTFGEIYRYVGDEVVVTWRLKKGLRNANCVRTFFLALRELKKVREKYYEEFGLVPSFSAALHCGKVIRGEIGDVKSQIVFSGDVLYKTAQLQKACGKKGTHLLLSSELVKRIPLPEFYKIEFLGKLDDKDENSMEVYTITESELPEISKAN